VVERRREERRGEERREDRAVYKRDERKEGRTQRNTATIKGAEYRAGG